LLNEILPSFVVSIDTFSADRTDKLIILPLFGIR